MPSNRTSARPNILLIITDHHAFYGHDQASGRSAMDFAMPRFGALAADGMQFERAYAVTPICTPARASMLTGVYPSAHGMRWNTDGANTERQTEFRPGQRLYSHLLSRAGYRNGYVGKWHCGHERLPVDYGIEGWSLPDYGQPYLDPAYRAYVAALGHSEARARIEHSVDHPEWEGQTHALTDPSPWTFMNSTGVLEGPPELHESQFTADMAVRKLRELAQARRTTGQPWSLVASFWGPHHPYFPSEPFASAVDPGSIPEYPSFADDYSGNMPLRAFMHRDLHHRTAEKWVEWETWQEVLARCYGQILQTDAAVGTLLDAVDDEGMADDTLVVWVADHGDAVASHGGLWDKESGFSEEVARIPMAMRWPGNIQSGQRCAAPVTNMDVTATILEAAGVSTPDDMHSRSLLPICLSGESRLPGHVVAEHNGHSEEILQRIVVTERYKYVAALFDKDELYDLENDPYELQNLVDAPDHDQVAKELRGLVIDHIRNTHDPYGAKLSYALALRDGRSDRDPRV